MAEEFPFVQIEDTSKVVHVVNTRYLVRVFRGAINWFVLLTNDAEIEIDEEQSKKLFSKLPGLPKTAGAVAVGGKVSIRAN